MKTIFFILTFAYLTSGQLFAQWIIQTSNASEDLYSVVFLDSETGFTIGGNGIILKTTNGGDDWFTTTSGTNNHLRSVYFLNSNIGYVVGDSGTILKTSNSGLTWFALSSGTSNRLFSVFFTDINVGYVAGDSGLIIKTLNGGINWITQNSNSSNALRSLFFTDSNTGYYIERHQVYKTINGGTTWNLNYQLDNQYFLYGLSKMFFIDSNNGYVVGGSPETMNSILLKTTDSGNNWIIMSVPEMLGTSIFFNNPDSGYIIAYKNILKTNNGGINWDFQKSNVMSVLNDVFFIDSNNGWIVGELGTVLHTTNAGVTFINNWNNLSNPNVSFSLSQNYPNPFNPTTNIEYSFPKPGFVTLKVYDVLGNKVATLVNEEKPAGRYDIKFDGSNLPAGKAGLASGIYFYVLRAGDFVQSRKMLLLK